MNNKGDSDDDEDIDIVDDDTIKDISKDLIQCPACLRRMRPEVYSKHPNVCRENPSRKRNVRIFDMTQYRAIKSGDKVIPVCKVVSSNENKSNSTRPSQTRSAKRNRRTDDAIVTPVINNFCT